eukprot:TRINITY_DN47002_c0_g1_i1.p1 TRINITY_DN47002_c0_g1~~TRINITY_DN47002_c0_g1_i1.p1  ORF type:complete len:563 (+),score=64.20 TRINITY_DN47002_c0_g1_i1:94-1689(+)
MFKQTKPKVVILTGPTGVGKTDTSLRLAELLNAEIISADSVQVYRGLNIGSDKIEEDKRQQIRHHLIDVLEPDQEFSAAQFYEMAREVTEDIIQRGKTPLIVGGTGFYLRMYMYRKPETGESTPELEAEVEQMLSRAFDRKKKELEQDELTVRQKWEEGIEVLRKAGDPEAADRIRLEFNNWYRLKRALQIAVSQGRPMSDMKMDFHAEPDYDFRCFFLYRPRLELFGRILLRVEQMVQKGLLKEAWWLLSLGIDRSRNSVNRSIGYRQSMEYLQECRENKEVLQDRQRFRQMMIDIATASRNLVKNQFVFFRDNDLYKWIDARQPYEDIANFIAQEVQKNEHQGGCGDAGRLTKEEKRKVKMYVPKLKIFNDDKEVDNWTEQVSEWIKQEQEQEDKDKNQLEQKAEESQQILEQINVEKQEETEIANSKEATPDPSVSNSQECDNPNNPNQPIAELEHNSNEDNSTKQQNKLLIIDGSSQQVQKSNTEEYINDEQVQFLKQQSNIQQNRAHNSEEQQTDTLRESNIATGV